VAFVRRWAGRTRRLKRFRSRWPFALGFGDEPGVVLRRRRRREPLRLGGGELPLEAADQLVHHLRTDRIGDAGLHRRGELALGGLDRAEDLFGEIRLVPHARADLQPDQVAGVVDLDPDLAVPAALGNRDRLDLADHPVGLAPGLGHPGLEIRDELLRVRHANLPVHVSSRTATECGTPHRQLSALPPGVTNTLRFSPPQPGGQPGVCAAQRPIS
jgi:hypothetical protein